MFVYSKKIIQFVNEIKHTIKEVLSKELCLKVSGNRFYDRKQFNSYPIQVVIYHNKSMLGYFDPNFWELGFHECLMHSSREQLHDVIRHELAHFMTFITYGEKAQAHGLEFRDFCQQLGWGENVYKATICLKDGQDVANIEESSVFRKIQKLMALSNSSNTNEAESAMIKSQQLLLKHNIESNYIEGEDEEKTYLKRILQQKKTDAKMRCIATILGTFFVSIVFGRSKNFVHLEILGNLVNIEIAEHVANVLQNELDNLWNRAKRTAHLKGAIAKNSFFAGIARGYCNKIQAFKREHSSDTTRALLVIEKKLVDSQSMVYPRLSSTKSSGRYCQTSSALGETLGRQLNINPAIKNSSSISNVQISFYAE